MKSIFVVLFGTLFISAIAEDIPGNEHQLVIDSENGVKIEKMLTSEGLLFKVQYLDENKNAVVIRKPQFNSARKEMLPPAIVSMGWPQSNSWYINFSNRADCFTLAGASRYFNLGPMSDPRCNYLFNISSNYYKTEVDRYINQNLEHVAQIAQKNHNEQMLKILDKMHQESRA
jgi:hypothetical protein